MDTRVPPVSEYVKGEAPETATAQAGAPERGEALVTTPISQTDRIERYPRSVRVVRPQTGNRTAQPPDRSGSQITGFSTKSRSRLRFASVNAFPIIQSQLGLTYHETWPTDGRACKRHLRLFLDMLRRLAPDAKYLWLLEFQRRNAPHFHIFLTIPPDADLRDKLARAWVTITGGTPEALAFHQHSRNWVPWKILNGSYLCKYLDKEAQKSVPEGYANFGRFWGNSVDLVPAPESRPLSDLGQYDQVDNSTGEVVQGETYIIRNLGRLAERQTKGFSQFRKRAPRSSYTILNGSAALDQIEHYLSRPATQLSRQKVGREVKSDECPF